MILMIDNYDSFTYNLVQYLGELGAEVETVRNDAISIGDIVGMKPEGIVISPGPCTPTEAGISVELVHACASGIPLLGVCLGHQCIGAAFGATVVRAAPVHGKVSQVQHGERDLFAGLPSPLTATRYHSLVIDPDTLPPTLESTAWTSGILMGLRHRTLPMWGVQFHPEAVLTEHGHALLRNFLALGRAEAPPGLAPGLPVPESPALPPSGPPAA